MKLVLTWIKPFLLLAAVCLLVAGCGDKSDEADQQSSQGKAGGDQNPLNGLLTHR